MAVKSDAELFRTTPAESKWQSLTTEEARHSALFGIVGWPLFFLIGPLVRSISVITIPLGLLINDRAALDTIPLLNEVDWMAMSAFNFIVGVSDAILVYLVFTKHARAADYWIVLLWLQFLSVILYSVMFDPFGVSFPFAVALFGVASMMGIFLNLVIILLLSSYMTESKRVNVTFRHHMPASIDKADWDIRTEAGKAFRRVLLKRQVILSSIGAGLVLLLVLLFIGIFTLGDPIEPADLGGFASPPGAQIGVD
ncbi:MAG: hypothetical protein ACPGO3_03655 [Magnetospiraceae bacterium]